MSKKKSIVKNKSDEPNSSKGDASVIKKRDQPLNYLVVNSLTGAKGEDGQQGIQGPVGPTGPQGTVGPTGPQGTVGNTGPQGTIGPTGPQGTVGHTGPEGTIGPTGPQGTVGHTGPEGTIGPTGPQGTVGHTGPEGTIGPTGPQGTVGHTGPEGTIGPTGPQGTVGHTGPEGTIGPTGPQGTVGNTGPQGTVGPTGPQGTVGHTGPEGTIGPTGPQGTVGHTGPQGTIGPTGPQGTVGNTGPQGTVGNTGPQGTVGPTGPQGTVGNTGPQGTVGHTGPTGEPGIEKESIILRRTNQSMSGYTMLNMTVTGGTTGPFWNECSEPPVPVFAAGITSDERSKVVFLVGGQNVRTNAYEKAVQSLNPSSRVWARLTDLAEPNSLGAVTIFNNELVIAGGFNLGNSISPRSYLLRGNAWLAFGGNMEKPVAGGAAVAFNGKIYVFGGKNGSATPDYYNYTQVYEGGKWNMGTPAPFAFALASAAVYGGLIYVYGGYKPLVGVNGETMPVLCYDPAANEWLELTGSNNTGLLHGSAAMMDNTIYYIGGRASKKFFPDIVTRECFSYNVTLKSMSLLGKKINTPRTYANIAALDRKIFVVGGTGPAAPLKTEYVDFDEYLFYLYKKI